MPHDKNGSLLQVGDRVLLQCRIIGISEGETQCNVTAEALERPENEGYIPQIAGNSRFYEKLFFAQDQNFPSTPEDRKEEEIIGDKQLRRDIDAILQRVKAIAPTRERSLCRTKLEEAVMWLGMDLKRIGTPNPYPDSKDPSNTKVAPTADGLKL